MTSNNSLGSWQMVGRLLTTYAELSSRMNVSHKKTYSLSPVLMFLSHLQTLCFFLSSGFCTLTLLLTPFFVHCHMKLWSTQGDTIVVVNILSMFLQMRRHYALIP